MKQITVKYIDTGEEKIWVWDGELLEAATAYDRGVSLANDFLNQAIPDHCYFLGNQFIHLQGCTCGWDIA